MFIWSLPVTCGFFFSQYTKAKFKTCYLWYWITAAWNKLRSCLKTRTLFFFTLLSWPQAASVSQYITVVFSVLAYFRKLQWASTHFIETTRIKKWLKMVNSGSALLLYKYPMIAKFWKVFSWLFSQKTLPWTWKKKDYIRAMNSVWQKYVIRHPEKSTSTQQAHSIYFCSWVFYALN